MALLILHPSTEELRKFGRLAHVTEAERARIMALPPGQCKRAIGNLESDVAAARKKEKR